MCSHHYSLTAGHFHHPKEKPPSSHLPSLPSFQPLGATKLLPISVDLPTLNLFYK